MIVTMIIMHSWFRSFISSSTAVEIISKLTLMTYTFVVIFALSKGKIALYGLKWARNVQWGRIVGLGLGLGIVISTIGSVLKFDSGSFMQGRTLFQLVVIGWIFASVSEEFLTRGLVQSYLAPLQIHGVNIVGIRISLPVFATALLFGLMHVVIFLSGASGAFVTYIVSIAFIAGLVAGYYREKTGSLVPAIVIHFLVNMGGSGADCLFEYLSH